MIRGEPAGPRTRVANVALVLLATTALSIAAVAPGWRAWMLGALCFILAVSAFAGTYRTVHLALFGALVVAVQALSALSRNWPWTFLLPLAAYGVIVSIVPGLRRRPPWLRPGRIDRTSGLWMLLIIVGSAAALVGWRVWLKPDLSFHFAQMPAMPLYLVPLAGLGFALLNAVMEEVAFRGILMDGLDSALDLPALSLALQALAFGLFHYVDGFPNGAWGVLMTFVYGGMLGWIKIKSRGLLAPVITHFFADLTIFAILAAILYG